MQKPLFFSFVIIILILAVFSVIGVIYYNIIVGRNEQTDQRWAQVGAVMQRKLDLIPNLVETVKGYAKHEKDTFVKVMEARGRLMQRLSGPDEGAPKTREEVEELQRTFSAMGASLGRLFAIVENYPDLKSSQNFLTLQDQLEGTENRITVERKRYNDAVMVYNRGIKRFPGNMVAAFFGFSERMYFEPQPETNEPLKVSF